jgi:hypothetical protein
MRKYRFYKKATDWFIDLPAYIEEGGSIGDLQMVDGADKMLDIISKGSDSVSLLIAQLPFAEADILILKEKCDPTIGGGYYFMEKFEGTTVNQTMWLCQVITFIFGDVPPQIFVQQVG